MQSYKKSAETAKKNETGNLLSGSPSLQVIDDMLRNCNNQSKNVIYFGLTQNNCDDGVNIANVHLTILVNISTTLIDVFATLDHANNAVHVGNVHLAVTEDASGAQNITSKW